MDMMMPSMDGLTIIPLLRQFNPNIYDGGMSGLNSTEAVLQAEQLGCPRLLA
jgi:two-component system cell cycle sensor histidine kinase/response regulator CckA